jgi:hypothetical protein
LHITPKGCTLQECWRLFSPYKRLSIHSMRFIGRINHWHPSNSLLTIITMADTISHFLTDAVSQHLCKKIIKSYYHAQ